MITRIGTGQSTGGVGRAYQLSSGPTVQRPPQSGTQQAASTRAAVVRIGGDARALAAESDEARVAKSNTQVRPEVELQPVVAQPVPDFYGGGRGDDSGYNVGIAAKPNVAEQAA